MQVIEHDLTIWRARSAFHSQLVDILGDTCREKIHPILPVSSFALATRSMVYVSTDEGMVHIEGAYTVHDDTLDMDLLIIVGSGPDQEAVLFTPFCDDVDYKYNGEPKLTIAGLVVNIVLPTNIGTFVPLLVV